MGFLDQHRFFYCYPALLFVVIGLFCNSLSGFLCGLIAYLITDFFWGEAASCTGECLVIFSYEAAVSILFGWIGSSIFA